MPLTRRLGAPGGSKGRGRGRIQWGPRIPALFLCAPCSAQRLVVSKIVPYRGLRLVRWASYHFPSFLVVRPVLSDDWLTPCIIAPIVGDDAANDIPTGTRARWHRPLRRRCVVFVHDAALPQHGVNIMTMPTTTYDADDDAHDD